MHSLHDLLFSTVRPFFFFCLRLFFLCGSPCLPFGCVRVCLIAFPGDVVSALV